MFKLRNESANEIFYATTESSGFDISANMDLIVPAGQWRLVKTGLYIQESFGPCTLHIGNTEHIALAEIQVRPRSGLALKHGITVLNTPCTIDADYRGEIMINLINHSQTDFEIKKGDRIAQGVCALSFKIPGIPTKNVERGAGGFGSTGI